MGILDEAIREHLELMRQHGADESALKALEDDAFGRPKRPDAGEALSDSATEAATEFMAQPDLEAAERVDRAEQGEDDAAEPQTRPPRREPLADVQEPPEHPAPTEEPPEDLDVEEPAAEEEQPALEHEAVSEPPSEPEELPASHSTEERQIIADQPTQIFDVEQELEAVPEAAEPSDEELIAEAASEPRLGPAEPSGAVDSDEEAEAGKEEDEEDFFDEQRLSDELDQALEAPVEPESEEAVRPSTEEFESEEAVRPSTEEFESEEFESADEEEEPVSEEHERPAARAEDEDLLEETPDFLEEAPEDDQLWFEQKPPKDFDFDD